MTREDAIAQLTQVFRHYGYEGATLSRISKVTGLGRASLYHHFPGGKEEMVKAVLNHVWQWFAQRVFAPLQSEAPPSERIRNMAESIGEFYNGGQDACLLAILSLGEADDLFHDQLRQALSAWIDRLAAVVAEAGFAPDEARSRAEDAISKIQGALVLVRVLNQTEPFERTLRNLPELLLQPAVRGSQG